MSTVRRNIGVLVIYGAFIGSIVGPSTMAQAGPGFSKPINQQPFSKATVEQLKRPVAKDENGYQFITDLPHHQILKKSDEPGSVVVAGTGKEGFSGDGGLATQAQLNAPYSVALGSNGRLFIADMGNHRIREVKDGIITTVAGTGKSGFSGDSGEATQAQLNSPTAVAVGKDDSLFIADMGNHRIRKVKDGVITTVAGTGERGLNGTRGPATILQLNFPSGVTIDEKGDLFIRDTGNALIRKVEGNFMSTEDDKELIAASAKNAKKSERVELLPKQSIQGM